MASQKTKEVLQSLRVKDGNNYCFECNSPNPQWVSVSYGVFLCLQCSGHHRGLGTHISFVRSTTMDKWKDRELQKMKVGGNRKAKEFFDSHSDIRPGMSLQEKYNTKTAALYRDKISTLSDGGTWSEQSSSARDYKPIASKPKIPQDTGMGGGVDQDLEDFLNDDSHTFGTSSSNSNSSSNYHEGSGYSSSGGGASTGDKSKYIGFGNTPVTTSEKEDDDLMGKAWSSMQTGWSSFTSGATSLANQAGGGMSKLGSTLQENVWKPSTQQANKFGNYVNESMIQPTKTKVNEGTLWTDISSSAGQLATKVKTGSEKGWGNLVNWVQSTREGNDEESEDRSTRSGNHGDHSYHDNEQQNGYRNDNDEVIRDETRHNVTQQPPQQPQELLIDFTDDPTIPPPTSNQYSSTASKEGYEDIGGGKKTTKSQDDWNSWEGDGWGDWGGSSATGGKRD